MSLAQRVVVSERAGGHEKSSHRNIHFSSATDEWETPRFLFEELTWIFGGFTLDPCATPQNAKCKNFFTRADDGLAQRWEGKVFVNPPLS